MTNEEPVPSTSCVLSAAEKNVKNPTTPSSSKKRKGLDIDALWRKKLKDVENHQVSPEKSSDDKKVSSSTSETPESTSSEVKEESGVVTSEVKVSVKTKTTLAEEDVKKEEIDEAVVVVKGPLPAVLQYPHPEAPLPPIRKEDSPPVSRSTRSSRKKAETEKTTPPTKMTDLEDVKPNIKMLQQQQLKKNTASFQCSNLDDGSVREEMEVIQRSNGDESTDSRGEDYEYGMPYPSAVTPNGTYTIYAPESTYAPYYPYQNNMQSSPQDNGAYQVIAAPQSPVSMDDQDGIQAPNAQRASPATVNWLFENYEIAEGSSLPRCQLYDHYRKHCAEHRMDPVNAASFGKLIRSVFQGLKTRRLGTRGNSKYHYYGIRLKEGSTLGQIPPQENLLIQDNNTYIPPMQIIQQRDAYADTVNQVANVKVYLDGEIPQKRMKKEHHSSSSCSSRDSISPPLDIPQQQVLVHQTSVNGVLPPQPQLQINIPAYQFTENDKAALGKMDMPMVPFHNKEQLLVTISEISRVNSNGVFRKLGMGLEELNELIDSYHSMCKKVLELVKNVQFTAVEDVWQKFWTGLCDISHESLSALCTLEKVQDYIIEADLALYQTIVDCLIPNVLLSELSAGMTQSCRTFAKNIDLYLKKALQDGKMTDAFIKKKLQAIKYMQQGLKRYTSLNHLAHAARGVLMKEEQCQQMYQDYLKVDISTVHQQAGWICGCDSLMVTHVNNAFKLNLQQQSPMGVWAEWLESIVDQVLAKYHDKPASVVSNVGKQFLLNWSFYTSMIIRDLTLRSAMSFGSFTLIRLLADDYMYYLIESKIAKAGKQQLITVIRQEKDWPLAKNNQEYIVPDSSEDQDVKHSLV